MNRNGNVRVIYVCFSLFAVCVLLRKCVFGICAMDCHSRFQFFQCYMPKASAVCVWGRGERELCIPSHTPIAPQQALLPFGTAYLTHSHPAIASFLLTTVQISWLSTSPLRPKGSYIPLRCYHSAASPSAPQSSPPAIAHSAVSRSSAGLNRHSVWAGTR